MKFKSVFAVCGLAFSIVLGCPAVQASNVDVSYTISGSAGNWVYDFTVTNNIPNTNPGYDFI
jgi:hypothetical protein